MRKDILPYYRALGLSPGAEAVEIRRAYRQMIQQWHPDLFKPGSPMQTTAEDITKEINEAYEQLYRKKLYRNFLPKLERSEETRAPAERKRPSQDAKAAASGSRGGPKPHKARPTMRGIAVDWAKWKTPWLRVLRSRWTRSACMAAVVGFILLLGRAWIGNVGLGGKEMPTSGQKQGATGGWAQSPAPGAPPLASAMAPAAESVPSRFGEPAQPTSMTDYESEHARIMDRAGALLDTIELGDSRARVRAIQGVPDEVSDSIYRYGSSVVYFRDGRVSAWRDRLPRLRIRDWSSQALPTLERFTLGSSRAEVVRAQGLPGAFDSTSYTYGSSIVSFDRGQVSGWSEGDTSLRHFEMPTLPFLDLDRMSLWDGSAL